MQPFTSVAYPPRLGHLRVATGPRARSAAGLCLYTPSRRKALAAHRMVYRLVSLLGTRLLPDRSASWRPEVLSANAWSRTAARLEGAYGDFALAGVHCRRSEFGFPTVGALIELTEPVTITSCRNRADHQSEKRRPCKRLFVQTVEGAPDGALPQAAALRTIAGGLEGARTPTAIDSFAEEGLDWFVWEAMPPVPHAPVTTNIEAICANLGVALEPVVERKSNTPAHWQPMHGDLTPWNLRSTGSGLSWILDWDDIDFAPPGADLAHFWGAALGIDLVSPSAVSFGAVSTEAIRFWLEDFVGDRPLAAETATGLRQLLGRHEAAGAATS